ELPGGEHALQRWIPVHDTRTEVRVLDVSSDRTFREALVERLPLFFASRFDSDGAAELHFWSGSRTMLIKAADYPSAAPYGMRHVAHFWCAQKEHDFTS